MLEVEVDSSVSMLAQIKKAHELRYQKITHKNKSGSSRTFTIYRIKTVNNGLEGELKLFDFAGSEWLK